MAEEQKHLRKDFMGRLVCDHCWTGMHEVNRTSPDGKTKMKVSNCLEHGCECLCNQVRAAREQEKAKRRARNSVKDYVLEEGS